MASECVASLRDKQSESEDKCAEGLVWRIHKYKTLRWPALIAVLLLQGATLQAVLGPRWLLLSGTHRPQHSPRPGIDDPILVEILSNPRNLVGAELLGVLTQ